MRSNVNLGTVPECHGTRRRQLLFASAATSLFDRIDAVVLQLAALPGAFPGLFKAKSINTTKTHIPGSAIDFVSENPSF
jgi:hypothetical protein